MFRRIIAGAFFLAAASPIKAQVGPGTQGGVRSDYVCGDPQ